MLVEQRQELLLQELRATGAVRVAELAERFGVSAGTIRRDIAELADLGRLTKVRGGAVPAQRAVAPPAPGGGPEPEAPADPHRPTIGLLVPSATYYYPRVVAGVREVAARYGARVVIGLSDYAQPRDERQIEELCASGADGLLIASTGGHTVPPAVLARLRATGRPFVLLERRPQEPDDPCEFVVSDHATGAGRAVRHLRDLGHRAVALFTAGSPTAPLVREGYERAVRQLELDPGAPVAGADEPASGTPAAVARYDAFIEECRAHGTRAALVHSDQDAIELLQRLRAKGLRTPDDLALIAYDDEIASLAEVPLTAVAPPKRQLGEAAAQLLLDRLPARAELAPRQVVLQPQLTVRESCGAASAGA
ncbi:substrate-binding domain-containing protein [Streptomyces sp. XM4011]|uniref:substrate-binding domain-containing protein n=1 Tax=Streptomyces TaxID=1883 RepID=UPI000318BC05|nr:MULTISPECIES: substrate-binding domain-containing protein [Streptomyces]MCK1817779.1 substrate-binding domain-containing protein [Streptomyces sp. XM4011]QKV71805.1 DeoR/GlpR family transcriptional regulator [Streptomyces harbinensis]